MKIIEIQALDNGAHNNQTINSAITVPLGWAIIPEEMETPNFPFGNITVDGSTPPVVTSWTPLPIPDPDPEPEPEPEPYPTTEDRVAALEAENKTLKSQVSAQSDQMDFYEDCIAEMASVVYA